MSIVTMSADINGKSMIFETGKLAKLADGAVTVRLGDTIVLVTAVSSTAVKEGQDFFPLTVEYKERAAAVGKFPGGYFKREGRPTEKEILTARMTDRPLRPMFPKNYFFETQVIALMLSADEINDPDILAINGASAAFMVSDIPFAQPIAAVRVARVNGQFVANPTHDEMASSDLDLVYVGSEKEVIMIEGSAMELPEAEFNKALDFAQNAIQPIIKLQNEMAKKVNKTKRPLELTLPKAEYLEIAYSVAGERIEGALYKPSKVDRQKAVVALKKEVEEKILALNAEATPFEISQAFDEMQKKAFRRSIFEQNKRCDGRDFETVRDLTGEIGLLPRCHGSSLFGRGETLAVCQATLGALDEAQELDTYGGGVGTKRFITHYNFPPFSVGECGRTGGLNRREIGHGALAERSMLQVIPSENEFPYAIRITSEVVESNGSTSMASVCGGILALMDAGVPIRAAVAGISVGLVTEYDDNKKLKRYSMLTDILGSEDHFGDMDFKLCGTREGVTGFQLDLKLAGIPLDILKEAVARATTARGQILDFMTTVIAKPKAELSQYAPHIETVQIDVDKIGALIGPGGKNIKGISAETGCEINIEDDGTVRIYSNDKNGLARAKEIIEGMTGSIKVGQLYRGRISGIKEFGAFVELFPGREGLVHISELANERVNRTEDVVKMGEEVWVKCIGTDDKGRLKLSRRAAMKDLDAKAQEPANV